MSSEQRGKRKYYLPAIRELRRLVKQHLGLDETAKMQATIDDVNRKARRAAQAAWQKEKKRIDELEEGVQQLDQLADMLARLALIHAGYHQHDRGQWRKRRVKARRKPGPKKKPGRKKGYSPTKRQPPDAAQPAARQRTVEK